MKILSVNAGSSSLKFQMYEMPEEKVLISGVFERIGSKESFYTIKINGEKTVKNVALPDHEVAVKCLTEELLDNHIVENLTEIKGIGHRLVHGGDKYASSVILTEDVMNVVEELTPLAPLHNPANLIGVRAFKKVVPDAVAVAVFDTAFHQTMEPSSYLYPVPYEWYTKYGIRKYGFHGTSHKFLTNRLSEILGKKECKIITCHLGNGGSISAVKDGKCIDTSMGFTPNAGIMMGSRSGDIDATMIPYIMEQTGKSLNEVMDELNKNSGYLGISGVSNDSRDIEVGIENGNERCILSQEMYIKAIVGYIAKYYVALGGVDAICFAGGVGENAPETRKEILEALSVLGIKIDGEANHVRGKETLITTSDSSIPVYIIPTDEEVMIARDTYLYCK